MIRFFYVCCGNKKTALFVPVPFPSFQPPLMIRKSRQLNDRRRYKNIIPQIVNLTFFVFEKKRNKNIIISFLVYDYCYKYNEVNVAIMDLLRTGVFFKDKKGFGRPRI